MNTFEAVFSKLPWIGLSFLVGVAGAALLFPQWAVARHWKVAVTYVCMLPEALLLMLLLTFLVWTPFALLVSWVASIFAVEFAMPRPVQFAFFVLLLGYYFLPTLLGGFCALLCFSLHLWAWKQAMTMGGWKWLFVGSFVVSTLYCARFVWWHLTGQKFGYL